MENRKPDPLEQFFRDLFDVGRALFTRLGWGLRQLKKKGCLVGLGVSLALAAAAWFTRPLFDRIPGPAFLAAVVWVLALLLPVLYLLAVGSGPARRQKEYNRVFADVGFIGKDKKYPFLVNTREEGKKGYLTFKSAIPLETWQKKKPELETALDCKILQIAQAKSKRRVELTTVDTAYGLPGMIKWDESMLPAEDGAVIIGETELGTVGFNLNSTPHVLSAGETGSGKSVTLRLMLWQLIKKGAIPFMIDFKGGVEFGLRYEDYGEVITDREKGLELLALLTEENQKRLELFRKMEVKNLKEYNDRTGEGLSRIVLIIDEIAEMMDKKGAGKEEKQLLEQMEGHLSTLARLSRATGINLMLGAQRPDANVLPGQIKNNVPVRICGRLGDKSASEIVLGNTRACDLPETKGRFLFRLGADTVEFQAYYFDDDTMLGPVEKANRKVLLPGLMKRIQGGAASYKAPEPAAKAGKPPVSPEIELNLEF